MENNNDQDYITLSENEDSSDELVEITPVPLAKKKGDVLQNHLKLLENKK